jgi:hypothetical protein
MTDRLLYVYGAVAPGFDASRAPAGLDDAKVEVLRGGSFAALLSRLPSDDYSPQRIEARSGEMEWVTPRALAHDRVMTWAQEHGGIIPMPMFSLWSGDAAIGEMLASRDAELRRAFERVAGADEYGLRIHRRDAEMLAHIHELDPDIAEVRRQADAAAPGQKYLLERKIAEQSKQAIRAASQRIAREAYAALEPLSREAMLRPLTPPASAPADTTLVLNAAFLVERARLDAFRAELTKHMRSGEPRGLTFDFTGPWPPYNFVG